MIIMLTMMSGRLIRHINPSMRAQTRGPLRSDLAAVRGGSERHRNSSRSPAYTNRLGFMLQ